MLGVVLSPAKCLVEEGLVPHHARALDTGRRTEDHARLGVVDAGGKLRRREPAEHDGVHCAKPSAGQHRHNGLRHHRQVQDDPIAHSHAESAQHTGERRDLLEQVGVRQHGDGVGDRAVVDQRRLLSSTGKDVPVDRVEASVQPGVGKPVVQRGVSVIEHAVWRLRPVDAGGGVGPETARIGEAAVVRLAVGAHGGILPG